MGRDRLRLVLPLALAACGARDSARIDSAAGERNVTGRTVRVAILGDPADSRIPAVREAIGHWNGEFARVGLPGHVLGLAHNADSTTLMCGRPAPCRPAVFASDTVYFFPLTAADERSLRRSPIAQ